MKIESGSSLAEYCKQEGINPFELSQVHTSTQDRLVQRPTLDEFVSTVETVSAKALTQSFTVLENHRMHSPIQLPLLPWEKWYCQVYYPKDNPVPTDLSENFRLNLAEKRTWGEREMFLRWIQSYGMPEQTLRKMSIQATTPNNREAIMTFDNRMMDHFSDWLDHLPALTISQAVTSGVLVGIGQHPEFAQTGAMIGGLSNLVESTLHPRTFNISNQLRRDDSLLSTILATHYLSHKKSLSSFSATPDWSQTAKLIHAGNLAKIEEIELWLRAAATFTGYATAQILSTGRSPERLAINATETAVTAFLTGLLMYKLGKGKADKWTNEYVRVQADLNAEAVEVNRRLRTSSTRDVDLNVFDTQIPENIDWIVKELERRNVRAERLLKGFPWVLATARSLGEKMNISSQFPPTIGAFINSAVILGAVEPLLTGGSRAMQQHSGTENLNLVNQMNQAIEYASYHAPSYQEWLWMMEEDTDYIGRHVFTSEEEVKNEMRGAPFVIGKLKTDYQSTRYDVETPIALSPGRIHIIEAPSGTGKSDLLRMISRNYGILEDTRLYKGLELNMIHPSLFPSIVHYVEATEVEQEMTTSELLGEVFLTRPLSPLLKEQMDIKPLHISHSKASELRRRFENREEGWENLVRDWMKNPYPDDHIGMTDSEVFARHVLTPVLSKLAHVMFSNHEKPEEFISFLSRKPGGIHGTSTGEGQRLEIFRTILSTKEILLFDEMTANLDGDVRTKGTSFRSLLIFIKYYLSHCPDSIIVTATNDPRLREALNHEDFKKIAGRRVVPTQAKYGKVTWGSKEMTDR